MGRRSRCPVGDIASLPVHCLWSVVACPVALRTRGWDELKIQPIAGRQDIPRICSSSLLLFVNNSMPAALYRHIVVSGNLVVRMLAIVPSRTRQLEQRIGALCRSNTTTNQSSTRHKSEKPLSDPSRSFAPLTEDGPVTPHITPWWSMSLGRMIWRRLKP
jgi:hypothetical protein